MNDLAQLADDVLLISLKRLTGTANELTAQLLAHLAEVEARGIHRNMACATTWRRASSPCTSRHAPARITRR